MRLLICLLVLIVTSNEAVEAYGSKDLPDIAIKDKSFSLTTSVKIGLENGETQLFKVEESYSKWQKRSKIQYETTSDLANFHMESKLPMVGTFFVDEANVLLFNREKKWCRTSTFEVISKLFQLDHLDETSEEDEDSTDLYLVGPARLLFFLDRYKDQLVKQEDTGRTRNIPSHYYEFKYMTSKKMLTFYVHYADLNEAQPSLPIRVLMHIPEDRDVSYDFILTELIPEGSGHRETLEMSADYEHEPKFDQFSLEPLIGCSQLMEATRHKPFRSNADMTKQFAFSFSASMEHIYRRYEATNSRLLVAYESAIESLKVQTKTTTRSSLSLANFRLGRTYHMIEFDEQSKSDKLYQRVFNMNEDDEHQQQQSCVITTAPNTDDGHCPYSLSELISGSNEFVFLGYAQVRGIWTRAFEAHNSSLPVWLEQPVESYIRARKANQHEYYHSAIVYMTNDDDDYLEGGNGDQMRPIMIDIYRLSALDSRQMSRTRVELYDFSWSVETSNQMDNQQKVDLFSLADLCPASGLENNHYGTVTMQLVSDDKADSLQGQITNNVIKSLEIPTRRNFALLQGLQNRFKLPITMVYDLHSRLEAMAVNENEHLSSLKLSASFHVAEHEKKLAELYAFGKGAPKDNNSQGLLSIRTATFRSCFFVAAHRKRDTFFAYRATREACLIDIRDGDIYMSPTSDSLTTKLMPRAFDLHESNLMEVYLVKHSEDPLLPLKYEDLTLIAAGQELVKYVKTNKKFELQVVNSCDGQFNTIPMSMTSLELSQQMDKDDKFHVNGKFHNVNKFTGFGLVGSDAQNKLIGRDKISSKNWASRSQMGQAGSDHEIEMTFDQCQAACLGDFECQSFSVCLESSRFECVISKVSFKSPTMLLQLMGANKTRDKKVLSLNVSPQETIQLKKHWTCELHNKLHLDLFYGPTTVEQSITRRLIHQVTGRDECARKCVEQTMSVLRRDVDLISTETSSKDFDSVINLFQRHQATISEVCGAFFYLEQVKVRSLAPDVQDQLWRRVVRGGEAEATNYCTIGWRSTEAEISQLREMIGDRVNDVSQYVKFERNSFNFAIMFEKQYAVGLRASPMTDEEQIASANIKRMGPDAIRASFETIGALVERNDNLQVRISGNEQVCADICFGQSFSLWPGCKSFDITLRQVGTLIHSDCLLNSMSLREAIQLERFDLIRDGQVTTGNGSSVEQNLLGRVWHFEPRAGFITKEVEVVRSFELHWWPRWASELLSNKSNQIKSLGKFWIILLASSAGLVLGVWLNRLEMMRRKTDRVLYDGPKSGSQYDTRYLVDKETVEFNEDHLQREAH